MGSLADGAISSGNNKGALNAAQQAQIDAQNQAIALEKQRYGDATANLSPSINAGNAALDQERQLLGLGSGGIGQTWTTPGTYQGIASKAPANVDWGAYVRGNPDALAQWQSQTPDLSPFGGDINKFGAFHYENDGARRDLTQYQDSPAQQQQGAIDALKSSPLYQTIFGNGIAALNGNAAATGGLRGGNIQGATLNFGRDTLSQVLQQQLANLGGLQSSGQAAAGGLATLGASNANAIGANLTNIGNFQSGGILGNQAISSGIASKNDDIFNSLGTSLSGILGGGSGGLSSLTAGSVSPSVANGAVAAGNLFQGLSF